MADDFRWMPFATEVDSLQTEVGCHQRFMSCWNAERGAVIPDPNRYSTIRA